MDVSIIVATHGSSEWLRLGNDTASICRDQFAEPLIRVHGGSSVSEARNAGAELVNTEWLCFIDAGDYVNDDYFEKMNAATGDLRAPRLRFYQSGLMPYEPFDLTQRNMDHENQCAIGTLIRKEMFDRVGGFWNERAYEDWSLFRRAWLLGATIEHVDTFYNSTVMDNSRNNTVDDPGQLISDIRVSHEFWRLDQ